MTLARLIALFSRSSTLKTTSYSLTLHTELMDWWKNPKQPATDVSLTSLSLTHVQFNPADPLSHLSAWLALLPQGLCLTYVVLLWATREMEIGLMFAGQMGCEALNWVLKRLIREERPTQMLGKGYGMPSSHSQFVAYFAVYLTLFLFFRHKTDTQTRRVPLLHYLVALATIVVAGATAWSRIYLQYHTPKQVLAGVSAGVVSGLAWFMVTVWLREQGWTDWVLDLRISQMLRMRDLVIHEDLVEAGYRQWLTRRSLRKNIKGKKRK